MCWENRHSGMWNESALTNRCWYLSCIESMQKEKHIQLKYIELQYYKCKLKWQLSWLYLFLNPPSRQVPLHTILCWDSASIIEVDTKGPGVIFSLIFCTVYKTERFHEPREKATVVALGFWETSSNAYYHREPPSRHTPGRALFQSIIRFILEACWA